MESTRKTLIELADRLEDDARNLPAGDGCRHSLLNRAQAYRDQAELVQPYPLANVLRSAPSRAIEITAHALLVAAITLLAILVILQ